MTVTPVAVFSRETTSLPSSTFDWSRRLCASMFMSLARWKHIQGWPLLFVSSCQHRCSIVTRDCLRLASVASLLHLLQSNGLEHVTPRQFGAIPPHVALVVDGHVRLFGLLEETQLVQDTYIVRPHGNRGA